MEANKSSRSKSNTKSKKEVVETPSLSASEEEKSFVEKMKNRATVKTYGIDNVSEYF